MTRLRPGPLLAALVTALVVGVAAPAGLLAPAAAAAASTDLTLVTDAVYTVQPDAGHVSVSVAVDIRNRTSETRTRKYWFDHAFLAVQPGATNVHLTGAKGARAKVARRSKTSTLVRLDFGSRLYSGKSATLRLAFDLPGTGKAASPQVRVGSSLVTLPVWAFASDGARGSTVTVRFPGGWDVAVEAGELERSDGGTSGAGTVLTSGAIDQPLRFFAYVTAQRPAVFLDRPVTLDAGDSQAELVLQGWTDDRAWSSRVEGILRDALPVLRRDIGLPWPIEEPLAVAESVSRDADAYAGRFDPAQGRIEIAYWADRGVVVHQAAHAWFNGALLADRWANEGFATWYALQAGTELGHPAAAPELTDRAAAAAAPLNAWAGPTGARTAADDYGYAASYDVAKRVVGLVGPDVLAAVWADAARGVGAYQPPAARAAAATSAPSTPEGVGGAPDWRGLLDLLEDRSGKDLVPLWRELVVTPGQAELLDARATARATYARTLALAGEWALPRAIRDALRAWDFGRAEGLMADARTVLAQRNGVAAEAAKDGLRVPDRMRTLFEGGSMTEASARAEAESNAILAIRRAEDARSTERDPVSRIGMVGEHPEANLRAARSSFAAGDLDATRASADRAYRAWTGAWQEGRRRALLALAAFASILVLGSAMVANLRRSRRARPSRASRPEIPPSPDDGIAAA